MRRRTSLDERRRARTGQARSRSRGTERRSRRRSPRSAPVASSRAVGSNSFPAYRTLTLFNRTVSCTGDASERLSWFGGLRSYPRIEELESLSERRHLLRDFEPACEPL